MHRSSFTVVAFVAARAFAGAQQLHLPITTLGGATGAVSGPTSLSADGRYVAFSSTSSSLVPGDTNGLALDLSEPEQIADALADVGAVDHIVLSAIARDANHIVGYDIAAARYLAIMKLVGYTAVVSALEDRLAQDGSVLLFGGRAKDRPYPGSTTVSAVARDSRPNAWSRCGTWRHGPCEQPAHASRRRRSEESASRSSCSCACASRARPGVSSKTCCCRLRLHIMRRHWWRRRLPTSRAMARSTGL